jgi:hypothetical protein
MKHKYGKLVSECEACIKEANLKSNGKKEVFFDDYDKGLGCGFVLGLIASMSFITLLSIVFRI